MGFFNFNNADADDVVIASRNNEGKLYKIIQLVAILVLLLAIAIVILEAFQILFLGTTANGIILSIGVIGAGGLTALPWVRVLERIKDKKFKITAIVFLAIIGVCVVLWIVCVWQIISLVNSGMKGAGEETLEGLITSLNTIRISIIVSLQFVVASYIAMNLVKYRKTLIPYQVMAGVANIYIDFYFSLLLTAFTITTEGLEISSTAMILTDKWVHALFAIAVILSIFPNIVFRRTDRRRVITTANEALENSTKVEDKNEKPAEPQKDDETVEEKLIKLKGLLDKGIISQEEYDKKRADILDNI